MVVKSGAFHALAYDADTQTLEIEFHAKDGQCAVWQYAPVDRDVVFSIIHSESMGKQFHAHVRMRVKAGEIGETFIGHAPPTEGEEFVPGETPVPPDIDPNYEAAVADLS